MPEKKKQKTKSLTVDILLLMQLLVTMMAGCLWTRVFTRALHVSLRLGRGTSLMTMVKWKQSTVLV